MHSCRRSRRLGQATHESRSPVLHYDRFLSRPRHKFRVLAALCMPRDARNITISDVAHAAVASPPRVQRRIGFPRRAAAPALQASERVNF